MRARLKDPSFPARHQEIGAATAALRPHLERHRTAACEVAPPGPERHEVRDGVRTLDSRRSTCDLLQAPQDPADWPRQVSDKEVEA